MATAIRFTLGRTLIMIVAVRPSSLFNFFGFLAGLCMRLYCTMIAKVTRDGYRQHVRFWPKADMALCSADVRFRG